MYTKNIVYNKNRTKSQSKTSACHSQGWPGCGVLQLPVWKNRIVSIQTVRLRILWIRQGWDESRNEGDTGVTTVRNSGVRLQAVFLSTPFSSHLYCSALSCEVFCLCLLKCVFSKNFQIHLASRHFIIYSSAWKVQLHSKGESNGFPVPLSL